MSNLRAGVGAFTLRFEGNDVEVIANTSGFEIVHGKAAGPSPDLGDG
jgi:hypothetical protein